MDINTSIEVQPITIELPIKLTMRSYNSSECEFSIDITSQGTIVLTPVDTNMEFIGAELYGGTTFENTKIETADYVEESALFILHASLLSENEDTQIDTMIDDIGQCVIYSVNVDNMFITATLNDSLNLVTEEAEVTANNTEEKTESSQAENPLTVGAEVIEESISTLTNQFEDTCGCLQCESEQEQKLCKTILESYYSQVTLEEDFKVNYTTKLSKEISEDKDATVSCPEIN